MQKKVIAVECGGFGVLWKRVRREGAMVFDVLGFADRACGRLWQRMWKLLWSCLDATYYTCAFYYNPDNPYECWVKEQACNAELATP